MLFLKWVGETNDVEKKQKIEDHKQYSPCEEFKAHSAETTTTRSSWR
jgi:hypothetical protein